ncbi:efflux RND transporter periplasmic adaptor subunit [Pseudoponticoccus marisrubri]|uniref:RND transporter n=1 Tax=Pseudoponticoccus marisrubri TaxID=1685382 RepID=A0A0W7WFV5_9RHOB|nr:HlyD family efflux transporter periplasmic adaptor subunit [Pseudoponticoccus marisrubri]KUF09358.1 RND transporter [Pseudoponticoccus marisrubri]
MTLSIRTVGLSALALAILGGLAVTAFRSDPIPVDLATLERGALSVTVDAEGQTRIRDRYDVAAPIAGTLRRAPVAVGDLVAKDVTVVAQVDPATSGLLDARSRAEAEAALHEAEAAVQYARAEVTRTEAEAAHAQAQYDRARALAERGAGALTALEDAEQRRAIARAATQSAKARLQMAVAGLERARAVLSQPDAGDAAASCCLTLTAPADGVVVEIADRSARPVVAGAPILTIGDPADLEIVVDLLSSEATRLAPGAPARVERWGGATPLSAELRLIEPAARTVVSALGIEEQRVDAVLDITSPPEARAGLGDGFAVFVRIEEWRTEDALLIPLAAVFRRGGAWFTFVVEDGVVQERGIEIGRRDGRFAVVEAGLAAGDAVILHPPDTIEPGVAVTPRARR